MRLKSVMIVDDDEHIRFAVRELFERAGFDVVAAEGAADCLRRLEGGFRGVILMDIMMPETDGWDAIRKIIEQDLFEGNIIAMLTAKDVPDEKMNGLQEYVIDYITKPFEPEELVSTVDSYFDILTRCEGYNG